MRIVYKRFTAEEILLDVASLPVFQPVDVIHKGMLEILKGGADWRTGNPTDREKMAILYLAGVPMRFNDCGADGMKMVTAVECGLVYSNGKYTVATAAPQSAGQKVTFRKCP